MPPREGFAFRAILQHYIFVVPVFRFGIFEWLVRTGRLRSALSAFVFPLLSAVGAGLLLAHSRSLESLKMVYLVEITHLAPAVLGCCMGMGAMARATAAAAGPSRVGLGLVAGAGSDRRVAPALPGE